MSNQERIVIVGAAETNEVGVLPNHSATHLHVEGALNALSDAGLKPADIDGIAGVTSPGPVAIAHHLGIQPAWVDTTSVGGTSFITHVRHAVAALQAGHCTTVLITHGESGRSRVGMSMPTIDPTSVLGQFEAPFGIAGPPTRFTIPFLRFMKETGTTHDHLAEVAVAQRRWSSLNPRARFQELITVDDVKDSPIVAWPFHLLECCLVTDGGGALVLTTESRARDLPGTPVAIAGTGEGYEGEGISMMRDMSTFSGFRKASQAAFAEADITHADVDHLMIYDAFAHLPLYGLEDMGFVGRGEAGDFIAEGNTSPGGVLPLNTNGGGLSYTHTGMYGMFALQESVRQLRGTAAAQLENVEFSVTQGNGGMFAAASTVVLTNTGL